MSDTTLLGEKLDAYVLLKILKYCTGSSARSYQCKFAVSDVLGDKRMESLEEVGAAMKEIIQYNTIRGKFSSVHPDLAAEGIARVEVGEEGLHFITKKESGELPHDTRYAPTLDFKLSDEKEESEMVACQQESPEKEEENEMVTIVVTIDEELLRKVDAPDQLGEGRGIVDD